MTGMTNLSLYAFWFGGIVALATVIFMMVRRNLRQEFPLFFSYSIFQILQSVLLLVLKPYYSQYFYAYWTTATLAVLIEFSVIYEIFSHVFRPYEALSRIAMVLFRWSALVLVMVAIVTAAGNGQSSLGRVMASIFALERSIRVMQVGLVLFLFLFSQQVGLTQRHRVFGISLGFGITAAVELTAATMASSLGSGEHIGLVMLSSGAFVTAACVWTYYMRIEEPERVKVEHAIEAGRLNMSLTGAMHPVQQESFLPFIEGAVERILAERAAQKI
jgi:hypothetical protein